MATHTNSYGAKAQIQIGDRKVALYRLDALIKAGVGDVATLPYSLRILLENLLRYEDGKTVTADDIRAVAAWAPAAKIEHEVQLRPARVLMQDFTGVPAVCDLAAMRDAFVKLGLPGTAINPLRQVDLVIDHSVQVDVAGSPIAFGKNVGLEYDRNQERYLFLRWGQQAFANMQVVPPGTGICHQVNLEYLAKVVWTEEHDGVTLAYPDSLVGTDSHTTMVNGLGVFGWGVGGIEAEAVMLGQPTAMLIPEVVGFELTGRLPAGATATDLVLTVTQALRKKGVVGKFVEFFGEGVGALPLTDRATIANMAPEYGATMGFFPVDDETLRYLRLTGRSEDQIALVERYTKENQLWRDPKAVLRFSDTLSLDLGKVEPSIAGPKRPQDRVPLATSRRDWRRALPAIVGDKCGADAAAIDTWSAEGAHLAPGSLGATREVTTDKGTFQLGHGAVVIAAITSCTNTSNPQVMLAAGLLARKAVARGLTSKPWVKTSLAPGSQVVMDYFRAAGVMGDLESLGFHLVGYGCTTCIGNSGPVDDAIAAAIKDADLVVTSVLSGNRNFEGRVSPGGARQLPGLAAAGRRVRAGRHDEHRPRDRAARHRHRRQAGLPEGHLADPGRGRRGGRERGPARAVRGALRPGPRRRRRLARASGAQGRDLRLGRRLDLHPQAELLRQPRPDPGALDGCRGGARARDPRRLGHDRPHLAGRQHREERPRGQVPR